MNYQFMNPVGVIISCVKVQKGKLVGMLRNIHFIIKKLIIYLTHTVILRLVFDLCVGVCGGELVEIKASFLLSKNLSIYSFRNHL
jgi:hypothetical protein